MILNPIIRKEVLSSLRAGKATAMQAAMLLVAALLVWQNWPADGLQDLGSQQARRIFSALAIGELAMVAMFAPAFTAASLTGERERRTLESLFATLLRPWEIAAGKMAGSLSLLVLLVLCGTPALALPMLLGGISPGQVAAATAVLLMTAVYLGMVGLFISTISQRSYRAILVTYAVLGVLCLLLALPAWPVSRNLLQDGGRTWQVTMHMLVSLSPLEAMLSLVVDKSSYATGAAGLPPFWVTFLPTSGLATLLLALGCVWKLRRPIAPPRPREKGGIIEGNRISARSLLYVIDPRRRRGMIRWWQNPVAAKEFRTRPMLQAQWLLRAIGLCLVISIVLMILVTLSIQAWSAQQQSMISSMITGIAALMVVLLLLAGPAMTAGAISADRESGVWDLMRSTPLSSLRIVSGKFQASVIPLVLLALAMAPALAVLAFFDRAYIPSIISVLKVAGMTVLLVSTAGLFFSSLFARTAVATAWAYGLVIALAAGSLLVLLDPEGFSQAFTRVVFMLNPLTVAMDAAGAPALQKYDLVDVHLKLSGCASLLMFLLATVRVFHLRRPK